MCFQYDLLTLALLAFEVTVYRHQQLHRLRLRTPPPPTRTLFHSTSRQHLDQSLASCLKYLLNYCFYKFGLEVRQETRARRQAAALTCLLLLPHLPHLPLRPAFFWL